MIPRQIFDKMIEKDAFSKWLGVELISIEKGECALKMTVRDEMCNGFGVAHGGITFSFADSAFAFASNSVGRHAVSVETSISHTKAVSSGDILTAQAKPLNIGNKLSQYQVMIKNQEDDVVALFKGTVYQKRDVWE